MNQKILNDADWMTYYQVAKDYWKRFEPEKSARTCLSYLRTRITHPAFNFDNKSSSQLKIILGAGGSGKRWLDFMGRPKHLVDTGDGLPLVQRTINLLSQEFEDSEIYLVIGKENKETYSGVTGCTFLYRRQSPDSSLYLEIIDDQIRGFAGEHDTLWLHGDVYWSRTGIQCIKKIVSGSNALRVFGRKQRNPAYGNNGGEDFGWFIPRNQVQTLRDWYMMTRELYISTPIYRVSTWELVSMISLAKKQGFSSPSDLKSHFSSPQHLCDSIAHIFNTRDFSRDLWAEIDDATEDFDFPIEYLNRLFLMVERIGLGAWQ